MISPQGSPIKVDDRGSGHIEVGLYESTIVCMTIRG